MDSRSPTDEVLFDLWSDGDAAAGHALFKRHFDALLKFFRRQLGDEAPDLVQETFLACVQARQQFRRQASFRTYLFAVARNLLLKSLRTRSRRPAVDFRVTSVADISPSPSGVVGEREEWATLIDALRVIPVEQQLALYFYYLEDLPAPAVGLALGDIGENAVRARLRRALARLRALLKEPTRRASAGAMATLDRWEDLLPATSGPEPDEHDIVATELNL